MPPNATATNGDITHANPKDKAKDTKVTLDKPTFCGTITTARVAARERREKRLQKPQPWVVRKLTVALTVGIMGYAGYVYAGRFAVRLMRGGRRAEGIGLLVGAAVLYAWMVWAYVKVVLTPPGTANDYISKTPQPLFPAPTRTQADWDTYDAQREQDRREQADAWAASHPPANVDGEQDVADNTSSFDWRDRAERDEDGMGEGRIGGPVYAPPNPAANDVANPTPPSAAAAAAPPPAASAPPARKSSGRARWGRRDTLDRGDSRRTDEWNNGGYSEGSKLPARARTTAPLLPPNRYCMRCEIVKPHRAHHCRACGKCILKYDHHCPWIGQCVGARNHKFFINFLLATICFTSYTLISVVIFNTGWRMHIGEGDTDPQEVVLIALAGLFLLFTLSRWARTTRGWC
ncbi:Palmitoyltransferase [Mycena sanguinolenta]|uniref:Palmitoyltransferase n=1 Tax=Mycena sanguinolenta TaxID=230812 RepID=A0A8H7DFQ0_9AGAR|nr:Palmitoyltransferase [Mycena sanguinolenta]